MAGEPDIRTLDQFIEAFKRDDNEWWATASGDLLNHFEELLDRVEQARWVIDDSGFYAEAQVDVIDNILRGIPDANVPKELGRG